MKLKTEDLAGEALNWAVAEKLGRRPLVSPAQYQVPARVFAVVPDCERVERFDLADGATAWGLLKECIGSTPLELLQDGPEEWWVGLSRGRSLADAVGRYYLWWTGTRLIEVPDELLAP